MEEGLKDVVTSNEKSLVFIGCDIVNSKVKVNKSWAANFNDGRQHMLNMCYTIYVDGGTCKKWLNVGDTI